jgi:hypothetical protein
MDRATDAWITLLRIIKSQVITSLLNFINKDNFIFHLFFTLL